MDQGFDPAAATAAYLATLPPELHAKAQDYTQGGHWLLLWGALVGIAVAWLILKFGLVRRVGDRVERNRARPNLAVMVILAVYIPAEFLLSLPWNIYANWWREGRYGLTSQPFGGWLGEQVLDLSIEAILLIVLLTALYALMRRLPRTWWLWGGGVVAAVIALVMLVSPVLIDPLFNSYKPAPAGPVRETVVAMAKANGVPSDKIYIYDGSRQSNRYTANVTGLMGTARVAMSDTMFRKDADIAEVRGVVGHEMGHYVQGHALSRAFSFAALAIVGFFLADRLFPVVARWVGPAGLSGISDPRAYPILVMVLTILGLLATPLASSITRITEAQADTFSLERFDEPDGLAKALVKTIEYRAATPSRLEEILFYDHPSVGSRVRKAMDWKAGHPTAPPSQSGGGGPSAERSEEPRVEGAMADSAPGPALSTTRTSASGPPSP